ncbi:MAG: hypothetical protein R3E53_09020 [Myxococcota bacterium]
MTWKKVVLAPSRMADLLLVGQEVAVGTGAGEERHPVPGLVVRGDADEEVRALDAGGAGTRTGTAGGLELVGVEVEDEAVSDFGGIDRHSSFLVRSAQGSREEESMPGAESFSQWRTSLRRFTRLASHVSEVPEHQPGSGDDGRVTAIRQLCQSAHQLVAPQDDREPAIPSKLALPSAHDCIHEHIADPISLRLRQRNGLQLIEQMFLDISGSEEVRVAFQEVDREADQLGIVAEVLGVGPVDQTVDGRSIGAEFCRSSSPRILVPTAMRLVNAGVKAGDLGLCQPDLSLMAQVFE